MSLSTYLQIDAIPLLTLIVLYWNLKTKFSGVPNAKRFQKLVLLVSFMLIVDGFNWYFTVVPQEYANQKLWYINILYFLLTEIISYFWFSYVVHQLYGENLLPWQKLLLRWCIVPLIAICLIIILSPWNRAIFYIDENSVYHRGSLHLLQVACGFGYMLTASFLVWKQKQKEVLPEKKKECNALCYTVALPFIGGALQIINYDMILLWPFTAAALFLFYVSFQRNQISLDALTKLNNRGKLEQYLLHQRDSKKDPWYLLFIDIDKFKRINDKYGHMSGDNALRIVANALKITLGNTKAFLSRYGGDEFAIVLDADTDSEVEEVIKLLNKKILRECTEQNLPYSISLSIGYAKYDKTNMSSLEDLTNLADQRMYQRKKAAKDASKIPG
ncbi:MAG: GGDEF domain-containing protein [Clostridia bacterium]|nr:GGDEF domain-containing protein [Clostridia bacterium]NCC43948.1 GGDEF domain-containing protein [Clostridia bacterium]